ncbi:putative autophagy ubiquitin-activating enzyme ApgG [Parasitella parasitica]|nr:putative autophagy ubiquitin-activating enzyme ApgG [Parasitella parasitica]
MNILKFTPFNSSVDASFWQSLVEKKLNVLKLSSESQVIHGYYTHVTTAMNEKNETINIPSRFHIPAEGLEEESHIKIGYYGCKGTLVNTNTVEEFRTIDKNQLFQQVTEKIQNAVQTGQALRDPNELASFLLLTFADLKKYKFYHWFGFPALMPTQPWILLHKQDAIGMDLMESIKSMKNNWPFFTIKNNQHVLPLSEFDSKDCIIGFIDPATSADGPGWPLRNLLYLVYTVFKLQKVSVLCWRPHQIDSSFIIEVQLPETASYDGLKSVGWERNVQGKLGPRMADLGPLMDPTRLADTSVDLNLKLMRWRLMPDLDLEKIKHTKCLLLGAGTLGCYVARCLIGWGVRHISFVDNGKVSFSNPVRQALYQFEDSLHGGSVKAKAAAKSLKTIQPTVVSEGYDLSIPMPGHHAQTSDERLAQDIDILSGLVSDHDVVFLLTDSRESRWFPTLLATKYNKIVINSALGFDTYLVMRHGARQQKHQQEELGCYFCNDIVAPTDSLRDRTLDQQCTVTRPGLAAIAGALAVELMVSLLQHPDGINAKADTSSNQTQSLGSILGLLPHQIRGFLGQFSNMLIAGQAYEKCTACSEKILKAYNEDHLSFVKQVLKDPLYLEEITGLAAMKKESESLLDDWDVENEDDF